MINFRYHFITIAAIFLALGIGILLGGTAGQSWLTAKEQEILSNMERKYNQALRSNNEMKQQINQLIAQVDQNNHEVIHLMTAQYAEDLQGQTIYVWQSDSMDLKKIQHVLNSAGIVIQLYSADGKQSEALADYPLLIVSHELPEWVKYLPPSRKWTQVESVPDSPAKQWKLLESVQSLLKEKRRLNEKSEYHRTGIQRG